MNVASIFGRTVPNFLADQFGALNGEIVRYADNIFNLHILVMIPSAIITACLIFAMLRATDVSGVVLFGIFYGIFSGSCGCHF